MTSAAELCNNRACDNIVKSQRSTTTKVYCSTACRNDCHNTPSLRRVATRSWSELDRLAELLAAALLIRGVEAKDCDALDQWLRL